MPRDNLVSLHDAPFDMFSTRARRIIGSLLLVFAVAPVDAAVYYGASRRRRRVAPREIFTDCSSRARR